METWFFAAGLVLVLVISTFISEFLTRRARDGDSRKYLLRVDQLEADIDYLSARLTKSQKQTAAQASVEARESAKSLKDEAQSRLALEPSPPKAEARPTVIPMRGR